MSFTTAELILLILIVSIILIIFIILTISEIRDYLDNKRRLLLTVDDNNEKRVKTVVRKEPIDLSYTKEEIKNDYKEEIVIPKPAKSAIIIEEEEEYYDPFFDEEDIDLTQEINVKEELHINDVINEEDVKESIEKVQDVIEYVDKKEKLDNYEDTITSFEMEQEENAIISLDELAKISDRMYEENEPVQYDDTDAPITIDEIMNKINDVKKPIEEEVEVTVNDALDEDISDKVYIEEDEEEDFLSDLSRAHRRMSRQ